MSGLAADWTTATGSPIAISEAKAEAWFLRCSGPVA